MHAPARLEPRRALVWGLVAVALFGALTIALAVAGRIRGAVDAVGTAAPPTITQQTVVEHLASVAKLVSSEMTLRDVVVYDQSRFGMRKRALLVVTGRVSAGIDLQARGTDVRIDSVARRITVSLPPAEIVSVDVLDVTTYDEQAGIFNQFRPEDRDLIQRRVREKLVSSARESGILAHADRSAESMLVELLSRDGYTVEVRRPPVQARPPG